MDLTGPARTPALDGVIDAARRLAPSRPARGAAPALVRRVSLWPSVRVELRGDAATIYSGAGEVRVARVRIATGSLTVFMPDDLAHALAGIEPLARTMPDGVGLEVRDADSLRAGELLIRRAVDLERFGPQWRAASP